MHTIFLMRCAVFFAPAFRIFPLILLNAAMLPLCGMEEGAEYTGGVYVSPFKTFEFEGKNISFNDKTSSSEYIKACALLYVFRGFSTKKQALLAAIQFNKITVLSNDQDPTIIVRQGDAKAFKVSGKGFTSIFFNLNQQQYSDYCHYCDSSREQLLVKALKGESHQGPHNSLVKAQNGLSKRSQISFGAVVTAVCKGALGFFARRPFMTTALVLGGMWWYRARAAASQRAS